MLLRNLILMLAALVKWVWSEVQSVTASIFSVPSDSVKGQFSSIKILGNTEYDEVTGIAKSTVSAMRLKSVGKNLWDVKNDSVIKGFAGYSIVENDGRTCIKFNSSYLELQKKILFGCFKPLTQYTLRYEVKEVTDTHNFRFRIFHTDGTYNAAAPYATTAFSSASLTSTSGKTVSYISIDFSGGTSEVYLDVNSVQLEEGTVATPYEPYTESTAYTPAGEPLRSLPNGIKDEISVVGADKGTLVQRVGVDGEGNLYELPEPIVTQHEITILDQDGNPTNALQCGPGYTVYVEPADGNWEETTIPTIEYVYPKEG